MITVFKWLFSCCSVETNASHPYTPLTQIPSGEEPVGPPPDTGYKITQPPSGTRLSSVACLMRREIGMPNGVSKQNKMKPDVIKALINRFPPKQIPHEIRQILNDPPFKAFLLLLEQYCKARDVLVIWKQLAKQIGVNLNMPPDLYHSANTVIEKADEFDDWLGRHNSQLSDVRGLYFDNKYLTHFPDISKHLPNLTALQLSHNQFRFFPDSIAGFHQLTTLFLGGNELETLSDSMSALIYITKLDLGANKLKCLPDWIGNLTMLEMLLLTDNCLSSLPHSIINLKELTHLYLSNNRLNSLPDLRSCSKLTELRIENNFFTESPFYPPDTQIFSYHNPYSEVKYTHTLA